MIFLLISTVAIAQNNTVAPSQISPIRAFYLGHSLTSDIPDMAGSIINELRPGAFSFMEQNIPGAPLRWHWDEAGPEGAHTFQPGDPDFHLNLYSALDSGKYSHFVITDSVPRGSKGSEDETVRYMGRILRRARAANNDVRVYYYETWHHLNSGSNNPELIAEDYDSPTRHLAWRPRIDADAPMWERIVRRVNEENPPATGQHPVRLIPAGRILAAVIDAAEDGCIPGFSSAEDFFGDNIHPNHYGKFVVAAVHAAILTRSDPTSYTSGLRTRYGSPYWNQPHWDGSVYPPLSASAIRRILGIISIEIEPWL